MPLAPTSWFEDAVDVPAWLDADRQTPHGERVRRDRDIARQITRLEDDGLAVRQWWQRLRPAQAPATGSRLAHVRRLISFASFIVGLVAGVGVALAAFQYDGTHPVNVVRVFALLVALPLALLVPTLLLALPGGGPMRPLQEALGALNTGSFAAAFARRLAGTSPAALRLFDVGAARAGATGRFAKWQALYWSQLAGTAFAAAALATGFLLVTFTDLAFGWSTTLAVGPDIISRIVEALSAPWRGFAPSAVPSPALVESSQYFRFEGGMPQGGAASRSLTGWWPFTLLSIATYALLPRLLLLVFARTRLAKATRALLLEDPQVTALLDRMRQPDIATAGMGPADHLTDGATEARRAPWAHARSARGIVWAECLAPAAAQDRARQSGFEIDPVIAAGGSRALTEDRESLERLGTGSAHPVIVFTPAWEPPLLEFLDFLGELRRQIGDEASIIVTPVGEAGGEASELERGVWSRTVGRVGDSRLYVETGTTA